MKLFFTISLFLAAYISTAQRVVDVGKEDVNISHFLYAVGGEPVGNTKFIRLTEGTPYFTDRWLKSSIVLKSGAVFKEIPAKVNLLENKIHFLDPKGTEMVATSSVKEIILANEAQDSLFRFVAGNSVSPTVKAGWYLWLQSGKASLYQVFDKQLSEQKPYGSATTEQLIKTKKTYVIAYNNSLLSFSKIKQVPSVLANKKTELENFIQKQNKNLPEEERIVQLIAYYNTLLQ